MTSTSKKSRVGFGFAAFGEGRWGWGDYAEILLWNYIPYIYKQQDARFSDVPLRKWTDGVKPNLQFLREAFYRFTDIRNPADADTNILPFLANDIGWVDDLGRTEEKRRTAIFYAWLLYLTKGSEQGYKIVGNINNVDVEVAGLWETACGGGGPYVTTGPTSWQPLFDIVPLDRYSGMFDDFFLSGGNLLALRFDGTTTAVRLLEVTEVKDLTAGVVLTLGVDYTVDLGNGTISLIVAQPVGNQIRATYDVNIPLDTVVSSETELWPIPVEPVGDACRTNRIALEMTRLDDAESEVPAGTSAIITAVEEFKPAHVVIDSVVYTINMPVDAGASVELT